MRPLWIILCVCAMAWSAQAAGKPADKGAGKAAACRRSPLLAGKCFVVHGELVPADVAGGLRIVSLGSDRELKVVDAQDQGGEEADLLPGPIDRALSKEGEDAEVLASFTVCPLTPYRTGWVQHVCVADAARVKASNPDDEPTPPPPPRKKSSKAPASKAPKPPLPPD